jgi:hypothetical protein
MSQIAKLSPPQPEVTKARGRRRNVVMSWDHFREQCVS